MTGEVFLERFTTEPQGDDLLYYLLKRAYEPSIGDDPMFAYELVQAYDAVNHELRTNDSLAGDVELLSRATNNKIGTSINSSNLPELMAKSSGLEFDEGITEVFDEAHFTSRALVTMLMHRGSADIFVSDALGERKRNTLVSDTVGRLSQVVATNLTPFQVTIDYDWLAVGQKVESVKIETANLVERVEYSSEQEYRNSQNDKLVSKLLEADSFFGLLEWLKFKKIPYVPVLAPPAIEEGDQTRVDGKNAHPDILLLGVGNGQIVPIQAKLSTNYNPEEYIDEMLFLTVPDLALPVDTKNVIVPSERGRGPKQGC